jgi:hypothetical protein
MQIISVAILLIIVSLAGNSAAYAVECTGSNTGTVVCLSIQQTKANLAEARKLGSNWRTKYNKLVRQCVKKIGGPDAKETDIGGASRLDLAECVRDKIKVALKSS